MEKNIEKGGASAVYGLGFIGAAVYFVTNSEGFWMVITGLLKALVWPAFLIYQAFEVLSE